MFLGIDIGTSATKTVAIDAGGKVLGEASEPYPCQHPRPLWSEQNPEDWWSATIATVRTLVKELSLKPDAVQAIGLSGQMHGAVFLDATDVVIRPAILWNDQRTKDECAEIETVCGGRENLVKMVANPALTGFTAPKVLWLKRHEPENYKRVHKLLLPKDEIRRRLTGAYATDVSDASGTLLLDVQNRIWSRPLLDLLGIDINILPTLYESPDVTGTLTPQAAKLLGLSTNCLVVAGAGDCPAGALGNGIVRAGSLSTCIGTSSVMMVHSEDFKVDPGGRLQTVCHAVPGRWLMMGVNLSGGGCLQWFRNELCKSDMAQSPSSNVYETLSADAARIAPGCEGLSFLPYLAGERTPHNDPDARGCFIGLTLAHTRAHMVRAIMEGVAYNMRDSLELIRELAIPVHEIRASGGGSRSQLWRQIQADVFSQSVFTINCDQGGAYGAALLAAVGAGAFRSVEQACANTINIVHETTVSDTAAQQYEKGYALFQKLYPVLAPVFKEISALEQPISRDRTPVAKA